MSFEPFGVLISLEPVHDGRMAIKIQPVTEHPTKEFEVTQTQILKTMMHGLVAGIRNIEDFEKDQVPGKLMKEVIDGLGEIYINPEMEAMNHEEFERLNTKENGDDTEPSEGGELHG